MCAVCVQYVLSGKQKIHFTFTDGSEMVEEYDLRNHDLLGNIVLVMLYFCRIALRSYIL